MAVAAAIAAQGVVQLAHAGAGWGDNLDFNGRPIKVPTFYANSPTGLRTNYDPTPGATAQVDSGTALRKFVDGLPGLTAAGANNLGQYLPLAVADTTSFVDSDYYELAVVEYGEKMHSDLPKPTTLRGYVQIETPANAAVSKHFPLAYPDGSPILDAAGNQVYAVDKPHYLGPVVLASKGRAVRFKFSNYLPKGGFDPLTGRRNGDLFLPVDTTLLGAARDPVGDMYPQNRATIHLHGGDAPWISDGTPYQWITPYGERKLAADPATWWIGASTRNVPDMPDPGEGAQTFYYPNNQSARLMFYHDHASGLTRVNVYGGEAAGYVLLDNTEAKLIAKGVIPPISDMIPLVIQDKTFVPKDIVQQDARWDTARWGDYGDLWFPHVYETNQDPNSFDGTNPVGRWDYGPWFWPIFPAPEGLPTGVFGDASTTPEAFMDTPVVNGTAYPTLSVQPKAYRFRILNAANDRFLNLGLYVADTGVVTDDGRTGTEVKMVPAFAPTAGSPLPACGANQAPPSCWPDYWPVDGRSEGAPDPATVGPDIIMIGSEGGFLPAPAVIPSTPIVYELNRRSITVLNILTHGLYLGSAERADAIIDFSQYAGKTLILYNDAPAPVPAFDPRIDYHTGNADQTANGGAESTKAGYGPNTRTIMQIKVAAAAPAAPYVVGDAATPGTLAYELPRAYGGQGEYAAAPGEPSAGQEHPVVGQTVYNPAFGTSYIDIYAKIRTGSGQQPDFIWTPTGVNQTITEIVVTDGGVGFLQAPIVEVSGAGGPTFQTTSTINAKGQVVSVNLTPEQMTYNYTSAPAVVFISPTTGPLAGGLGATGSVRTTATQVKPVQNKAIQELFEPNYGRMNATLGIELPMTSALTQTTVPLGYVDPTTEIIKDGETQIWKITHNGVDTHPVHFHLMNVQLVNRIGWDGTIKPPTPQEVGWKETIKMNPLEDIVVAISPKTPRIPFGVPESTRYRDPAQAPDGTAGFTQIDYAQTRPDGTPNPNFGLTVPRGTVKNTQEFYEWEYVWHCHILGHEENDFMRPMVFQYGASAPTVPTGLVATPEGLLTWSDPTPASTTADLAAILKEADPVATAARKTSEYAFRIERVEGIAPPAGVAPVDPGVGYVSIGTTVANATSFTDQTILPGRFYWYRVVAVNAKGEAVSAATSMTATSAGAGTPPQTVTATAISPTIVNLAWTYAGPADVSFIVKRCIADAAGVCTGALVTLATTAANATSYSDTTVSAETTYVYQVIAHNAAGDSAPTSSNVVTTLVAPATAPSMLVATPDSDMQVTLTWQDNSANEAGFLVQRSADSGVTWTDVMPNGTVPQNGGGVLNISVAANVMTLTEGGLTQNTAYLYRVASITAGGASTSAPVPVTTLYSPAPNIGTVTSASPWNQVTLNWTLSPAAGQSATATAFRVDRTDAAGLNPVSFNVTGNVMQYVDNAVTQATTYLYRVTALNGGNAGTTSAPLSVTTAYGAAPALAGLAATVNGTTQVALNWAAAQATEFATGVRVERCVQSVANFNCTSPTSVFTQVYAYDNAAGAAYTVPGMVGFIDATISPSTDYTYRVYYVNGPNAGASATTAASVPASFAVVAPTSFTATLQLGNNPPRVQLRWVDASTNETAFVVERSVDGVNFAQIGQVVSAAGTGTARTFNDTAVAPGSIFTYRVKAINVAGQVTTESAYVGPLSIDMMIGAPTGLAAVVTASQVQLSWTDNSTAETSFVVFRSADGGATWAQAGTATALAGTGGARTFNDNALTLVPGATYQYYVVARWNYNGTNYDSVQSNLASAAVQPLPAPTNLVAAITTTAVNLTWRDNASNETRYEVQRSADGGATWDAPMVVAARAGTGNVSFADTTGLVAGTTYTYQVTAVNVTGGVTTASAAATITVPYAAPATPANVAATPGAAGSSTITVSWSLVPFATGYTIERARTDNTATPTFSLWATVGATTTSRSNTGMNAGRTYIYRVRANNALGSSAFVETAVVAVP
ncbi:MAG: fibronectin type III domain-containing protein [Rhodocyclales bacterium]|nr:fibronectin type III domain-containing protein [Rhodocyclales bacterium]